MWNEEEQMRWVEQTLLARKMEIFPAAVLSFVVGVGHSG